MKKKVPHTGKQIQQFFVFFTWKVIYPVLTIVCVFFRKLLSALLFGTGPDHSDEAVIWTNFRQETSFFCATGQVKKKT